jgi:ABC-type glutathione transport system ATPase component
MKEDSVAKVHNLTVDFKTIDGTLKVLKSLSIDIHREEVVGVVGETG